MDGRINISVATDTPAGIILPLRNLGGRFNLGWPYFAEVLAGQSGIRSQEDDALLYYHVPLFQGRLPSRLCRFWLRHRRRSQPYV